MISIYHNIEFNLIPLNCWAQVMLFMESHPDLLIKRVGICNKFYPGDKLNEELMLADIFWSFLIKDDSPIITYDFYCGDFWLCLHCKINMSELIYEEYSKIEKLN